jgi:antiviral helicase SLH1
MASASSSSFAGALKLLVDGNALADDLSSAELTSLQAAIAQLSEDSAIQSVNGTAVSAPISDPGPSRQRSLWGQVLDAADLSADEAWRGDAVERHADEMEAEAAHQSSSALPKLEHLLSSMDRDVAASLRLSISELLPDTGKSDDVIAAELAELLGYEHLELVGEVVGQRHSIGASLRGGDAFNRSGTPLLSAEGHPSQDDHSQHLQQPSSHSSLAAMKPIAKPYTPRSQLTVHSAQELAEQKALRAANRRSNKNKSAAGGADTDGHLTFEEMEQLREQQLAENASRPLFTSDATSSDQPKYPHVFASGASGNTLSIFGSKFALPLGTTRAEHKEYEEVTIPPPRAIPMRFNERLIPIGEMDTMCRGAFPGYKSLNRLQSVVYPLGYGSNENMLVCAPTGAGKTDVAMLAVLRAISQYTENLHAQGGRGYGIKLNDFKIIYVAPMKALAAEIVRKFSKRLAYLGVKVRELTGDMQMTRQEINETQMIVTTPEKWDVVTRKPTGEGELASKVKLLIIDEVHLLHEDRGAVIETIVARTLRLVESSQSLIRIVGLSATLPNYVDVADFLRVNRYQGLFYFDSSFRPVPLEQHFLGVKGKAGSPQSRTNLDKAMFLKVEQLISDGHQVMVFVHARKETVKTATTIREMCRAEGSEDLLLAGREDKDGIVNGFKRDLASSRNKELKELFESGLGIHHAGMLRSDRTLSERMFETGVTKVSATKRNAKCPWEALLILSLASHRFFAVHRH